MPGTRLPNSPFRWAPATWMIGNEPEHPDPLAVTKRSQLPSSYPITLAQSRLTDRGLLVRYPGYRLRSNGYGPKGFVDSRLWARFPVDLSLQRWYIVHVASVSVAGVEELLPQDEALQD
jgi:hypothetical protein